jgi:hypothetical protein
MPMKTTNNQTQKHNTHIDARLFSAIHFCHRLPPMKTRRMCIAMTSDQIAELITPEFNRNPCKLHTTPGNVEFNLKLFPLKTQPNAYKKPTN